MSEIDKTKEVEQLLDNYQKSITDYTENEYGMTDEDIPSTITGSNEDVELDIENIN